MSNDAVIRLFVDAELLSPYAMSVYVALTEKRLALELETVDLEARDHLRPPYSERSITARVPMIEHDGICLSESSAITEYLEDVFPPPAYPAIYPAHPVARAAARQVQAWLRSDLAALREERPTSVVFLHPRSRPLSDAARAASEKLFSVAQTLLGDTAVHLFDDWCIADTELALMLNRLVRNGDEVPERLARYAREQWTRPSVQSWLALDRRHRIERPWSPSR